MFKWPRASRTGGLAMGVALTIVGGLLAILGITAWAAGTNAGNATVTDVGSPPQPITSGGSATLWSLKLPSAAACTKDTASGQYHVYGYIVPSTVDVGSLSWDANGPVLPNNVPPGTPGGDTYTLYDQGGQAWAGQNTAQTTGIVPQAPNLNYANYSDGSVAGTVPLPAGIYNVGIACVTNTSTTDKFWNVQETFAASATDPNKEKWTVTGAGGGGGGTTTTTGATTTTTAGGGTTTTSAVGTTTTTATGDSSTTSSSVDTGTSSTTSPAVAAASASGAQPATLASTGSRTTLLIILGVLLFSLGLAIVALTLRPRRADLT